SAALPARRRGGTDRGGPRGRAADAGRRLLDRRAGGGAAGALPLRDPQRDHPLGAARRTRGGGDHERAVRPAPGRLPPRPSPAGWYLILSTGRASLTLSASTSGRELGALLNVSLAHAWASSKNAGTRPSRAPQRLSSMRYLVSSQPWSGYAPSLVSSTRLD